MKNVTWEKWNPEGVVKTVQGDLVENMELACKFVEQKARSNLRAIVEPEWGRRYRHRILARRLTSEVRVTKKMVVGAIGIRSEAGKDSGLWIELGTATIPPHGKKKGRPGHPAHPYLRPALFNHRNEILSLLGVQ